MFIVDDLLEGYFSAKAAKTQRDFERKMSNSSYQRAVKDLRKAGLNPALAYGQGGASTPSVGIADVPHDVIGRASGRQQERLQGSSARSLQRVQESNLQSSSAKNAAEARLADANAAKAAQETSMLKLQQPRAAAMSDLWSAGRAAVDRARGLYNSIPNFKQGYEYGQQLQRKYSPFRGSARPAPKPSSARSLYRYQQHGVDGMQVVPPSER